MAATENRYTPGEVVARGKALYERSIRARVESDNVGRLLMIDLTTGNWVMGEDRIAMARELRARNPDAVNFGMRVGYPTTGKIGWRSWSLSASVCNPSQVRGTEP